MRPFYDYAVFTASEDVMFFQFEANNSAVNSINSATNISFNNYKLKLIIT